MYGGGFATVPAYLKDMFGTRYVGAIHGLAVSFYSATALQKIIQHTEFPKGPTAGRIRTQGRARDSHARRSRAQRHREERT